MNHLYSHWQKINLTPKISNNHKNGKFVSFFPKFLKQVFRLSRPFLVGLLIIIYRLTKKSGQNLKQVIPKIYPSVFYFLTCFLALLMLTDYLFALTGNLEKPPSLFFTEEKFEKKTVIIENSWLKNQDLQNQSQTKDKDFEIATLEEISTPDLSLIPTTLGGAALINPETNLNEQGLERIEIENYTVQPGDTISSIAQKFNISLQTILWENKLTANSVLRPGQILKILPISGVTHTVKSGDTIGSIAKRYQALAEDILDFNNLADASDIHIGDLLIIPEGRIPAPPPRPKTQPKDKTWLAKEGLLSQPSGENCHVFIAGQCTWYVARKRCVPWTGHARAWIGNAQRLGFTISRDPAIGAIISLRERSRWGHVGYVESYDEETVTFSEMNYIGPWVITKRTLPRRDPRIIGYIL